MMIPDDPNTSPNSTNELPPNLGLTVGFVGTVIFTIGYIINTIGDGIVLYEANRDVELEKKQKQAQQQQFKDIQNKLDFLVHEIEQLKRRG